MLNDKAQFTGLRHGEVALISVKKHPGKKLPAGDYILAHSETGHHHVLEGTKFDVLIDGYGQVFVNVQANTDLVHRKAFDRHRTITIPPSFLKRYEMVEYEPKEEAIQVVRD